ncbi:MAG: bifunctional chorismate mutase/prephenate dehydrogenase [Proteobacteria bacterium]|nr:bifunctional chorismate mutase/prephenate dehydrogenase [Pseudomonadota bacterium]
MDLEGLREQIDAIDSALVDLLSRRREAVDRVAEIKRRKNLPLYHPAREEDLISRRRDQGRAAGLDPDTVEDVFRLLLRSSRITQSAALASHGVRPGARVLLVGGKGNMGRSLRAWFGTAGYEVRVLDREEWPRVETLCREVDLAVIAVPIDATCQVASRLGPHLPPTCVLADITSVKVAPMRAMLAAHAGPVIGFHPMFGPGVTTMDKQIVVVTPGRDDAACAWVPEQLAAWGAVVVQAHAEEHDEVMAVVQALRHFATFAFGQFLCHQGVPLARTLDFSSPIYRLELGMVGRLFAQDPGLYAEIIFATPERRELLRRYVESLAGNLSMIETGDREQFCGEFRRVAEWFGPFGDQAIRESSYLIEKLVERF